MKEIYVLTKFGDASEDLKKLYSEGWTLKTVVNSMALSIPAKDFFKKEDTHLYLYAVDYFLER